MDWAEILKAENLPLNGELVCYLQNGGISIVLRDGKQLSISKKSKRGLTELTYSMFRNLTDMGHDFSETLHPSPITIQFHNGKPSGLRRFYREYVAECRAFGTEMIDRDYQRLSK